MAIESAAVPAKVLAHHTKVGPALLMYSRLRQPRTWAITNESWSAGKLSGWSNPVGRAIRNWSMRRAP